MRFVLASASPGRLATLQRAGVHPEVRVSGVPEDDVTGPPADVALTLARRKAYAVAAALVADDDQEEPGPGIPTVVLGCDSVLDLDGDALGKPRDRDEARDRWRRMRGRRGILVTGHCLLRLDGPPRAATEPAEHAAVAATTVCFADLDDEEVDAYVATGEPLRVAGSFTVDGLGGPFVTAVDGDFHNVVGLSLPLLRELVRAAGLRWTDLWRAETRR